MAVSEELQCKLDNIIKDLRRAKKLNDANLVVILKNHLVCTAKGFHTSVSINHRNNLLKGINIVTDRINADIKKELFAIISHGTLLPYVNIDIFKYIYDLKLEKVSEHFFTRALKYKGIQFLLDYNITYSYDQFIEILKYFQDTSSSTILENIISEYRDYFITSIKEYPLVWAGPSCILKHIKDTTMRELVFDNIPFNKGIIKNAIKEVHKARGDTYMRFLPGIVHRDSFIFQVKRLNDEYIRMCYAILCNKYNSVNLYNKQNTTQIINVLLHEEHIIKLAKNYRVGSDIFKWKVDFKRMFTFKENLLRISTRVDKI